MLVFLFILIFLNFLPPVLFCYRQDLKWCEVVKWGKGKTSFMYQILGVPCHPLLVGGIIDQIPDSVCAFWSPTLWEKQGAWHLWFYTLQSSQLLRQAVALNTVPTCPPCQLCSPPAGCWPPLVGQSPSSAGCCTSRFQFLLEVGCFQCSKEKKLKEGSLHFP